MLDQPVHHTGKKRPRVVDDLGLGVGALGDLVHVVLELARHLGRGDTGRVGVERVDDRHAELARLAGVVLEVLALIERIDDARARGLGAEAALLHLLDELALAVARGRLGLLGGEVHRLDVAHVADVELGKLVVLLEAIGVDGAEAGLGEHVARGDEGLAGHIERDLGALDGRRPHEGGEEAARDQVVELPRRGLELVGVGRARGVDGRVVGRLLFAAGGGELGLAKKRLAGRGVLRHLGDGAHAVLEVERARVDGVVHAGIRDEAVHIEALGQAHGSRGADALGRRGGLEARGVEGHGRALSAALALDVLDRGLMGMGDLAPGGVGGVLLPEAALGVGDLEGVGARVRRLARDHPVVVGHKGHALALALDHEGERRGLDTAGRAGVAQAAEARRGEVARKDGAPDEVDVLAALAGVGEVLVEVDEVREGVVDLGLGEGGVARAGNGHVGVHVADLAQGVGADKLALAVEVGADHDGIGLLCQVLERADDALLGRELLDRGPHEVREARDLPALDVDAVLEVRLALGLVRRALEAVGQVGGHDLALRVHGEPALRVVELELGREVGLENVPAQADGHAVLTAHAEAIDGRVVDFVGLGLARLGKEPGDLACGVVLLGDDKLQGWS